MGKRMDKQISAYERGSEILKSIKTLEAEIERLEDEMSAPGAEISLINEQIEGLRRDIKQYKDELRKLNLTTGENIVDYIEKEVESIKRTGKVRAKLMGKKLVELKDEYVKRIRQYAIGHKSDVIKKSEDVVKKKKARGDKKIDISEIIAIVAMLGIAGNAIGYAIKGDNPITIPQDPAEEIVEIIDTEVKPRYVVNRGNMYKAYEVNNEYGFINLREAPTTSDRSNIICKVKAGDTIYVKVSKPDITTMDANGEHDWHECMVFNQDGVQQLDGFVDINLLAEKPEEEAAPIFKDEDIEVIEDSDRAIDEENEVQLDAYAVDVPNLNVREDPSTKTGNIITTLGDGDVVYSYSALEEDIDDPDHDWKHMMYKDGSVYRTCFLDGNYITEPVMAQSAEEPQETTEAVEEPQEPTGAGEEVESETSNESSEASSQDEIEYDDIKAFSKYPGYVEYLTEIKRQHPNWTFKIWETGQDFQACVDKHQVHNAVAVENNGYWSKEWFKNDGNGYIYVDTPNWYAASKECTAAMMDPRNFLNEVEIFQFEVPKRTAENVSLDDVKRVFSNVGWANAEKFSYMDTNKNIVTLDKSFAELLYDVCKEKDFNPLLAASSIITEQGRGDVSDSITGRGTVQGYEGLYNYGNVGAFKYAYDGVVSAGECGLIRARAEGWTTPEAAIAGYVQHEIESFVDNGKDCKYLKKFDITGNGAYVYMTSFAGAYNEAKIVYEGANLDQVHEFKIPVFENMPENLCPLPAEPGMVMDYFNGGVATREAVLEEATEESAPEESASEENILEDNQQEENAAEEIVVVEAETDILPVQEVARAEFNLEFGPEAQIVDIVEESTEAEEQPTTEEVEERRVAVVIAEDNER